MSLSPKSITAVRAQVAAASNFRKSLRHNLVHSIWATAARRLPYRAIPLAFPGPPTCPALPAMRAKRWGRIVNISSGAARGAGSIGPHYNASKAGIEGLTRGYAARLVKEGITVAPSLIETDVMGRKQDLVARIPLGRFGASEEVAQAVMSLVGNGYMTGQTIALSGGDLQLVGIGDVASPPA